MGRKTSKKNSVEEKKRRSYFVRLFGEYDFRNEEQFHRFGTSLFFVLLILVELLVILQRVGVFLNTRKLGSLLSACAVTLTLTVSMAVQLFTEKEEKTIFYVIDAIAAGLFLFFAGGSYAILVYLLVLTQFYIQVKKPRRAFLLLLGATMFYMLFRGLQIWLYSGEAVTDIVQLIEICFGAILALDTHFVVVQIALAFYRQYFKLHRTLSELDESKRELEKAYEELEEVTVLKERQRIAREIHDTVGHSLTTVIMQTESAKRIIDSNTEEAKTKIVAANLQAKNALEGLRNSVHLLSGIPENTPLKSALLSIIRETMDGTGIVIRYEIADVTISKEKYRFLCNALREGISNGLRHGGATAFWFELKEADGKIRFLLSDNGKGINGNFKMGFGLRTMGERVQAFGGELIVVTDIEEGFEFRLELLKE